MRSDFFFGVIISVGLVVAGAKFPDYDFLSTAGYGGGAGILLALVVGTPAGPALLVGAGAGAAFTAFEADKAIGGIGWGGANRFLASGSTR